MIAQAPDGETQPTTDVDLFVSTEKLLVLNTNLKVFTLVAAFTAVLSTVNLLHCQSFIAVYVISFILSYTYSYIHVHVRVQYNILKIGFAHGLQKSV